MSAETEREALADKIHASHRKWCLRDKRCPEAGQVADALIVDGYRRGPEPGDLERAPLRPDEILAALTASGGVLLPAVQSLVDDRAKGNPYLQDLYAKLLTSNDLIFESRQVERAKVRTLELELADLRGETPPALPADELTDSGARRASATFTTDHRKDTL